MHRWLLGSHIHPRRLAVGAVLVTALGAGPDGRRAEAYRLYDSGAAGFIVGSDQAIRWAPEVWRPGSMLRWQVEAAPEWEELLGSASAIGPVVTAALTDWSAIESADIRWNVAEATPAPTGTWTRDGESRVFLPTSGDFWSGGAGLWFTRDPVRGVWDIAECDVGVSGYLLVVESFQDLAPELRAAILRSDLSDSFSSCLGLARSASFPIRYVREAAPESDDPWDQNDHFFQHAVLSNSPLQDLGAADRRVGASLLRPKHGWLADAGTVSGSLVLADGAPASYNHVWAFRLDPEGALRDPVGAFADRSGAFRIEGLESGTYVLWAHPVGPQFHGLFFAGAVTDVEDAVRLEPVTVGPGHISSGLVIPMQRGRR